MQHGDYSYYIYDLAQALDGTWHDVQVLANVSVPYTITVQFTGKLPL